MYKDALIARYVPSPGNIAELHFNDQRARLTIVFDDVVAGLARIKQDAIAPQGADAWFLDGFAPSKNPGMWSEEVFKGVALLSRPGTTLSTFTVAGFVRRGLKASGFKVQKVPGHGKKNQILAGFYDA